MSKCTPKRTPQKCFVATFCYEQRSLAYVRIKATSQEEAEEKAWGLADDDFDRWKIVHGDQWVESVEPHNKKQKFVFSQLVKDEPQNGGQSNE